MLHAQEHATQLPSHALVACRTLDYDLWWNVGTAAKFLVGVLGRHVVTAALVCRLVASRPPSLDPVEKIAYEEP